ncbi:MAG: hypothetical protein K2K32_08295, partial [Muribaculaceae bacterium]|nr:hypothetical protein [Muribaculaceae bacterium]
LTTLFDLVLFVLDLVGRMRSMLAYVFVAVGRARSALTTLFDLVLFVLDLVGRMRSMLAYVLCFGSEISESLEISEASDNSKFKILNSQLFPS